MRSSIRKLPPVRSNGVAVFEGRHIRHNNAHFKQKLGCIHYLQNSWNKVNRFAHASSKLIQILWFIEILFATDDNFSGIQ